MSDKSLLTHPDRALGVRRRHAVRPRLAPGTSVAAPPPRIARALLATAEPVGEQHNGGPGEVMLQGFHWTSCRSKGPSWYAIVNQNAAAIRAAGFDLVWLPPPSQSVIDEGYMPTRWTTFDTPYGTRQELQQAIQALGPVRALADVVVNHRCGVATGGADFDGPPFVVGDQRIAICQDDESGVGTGRPDTGEYQLAARDLDHTNVDVQAAIVGYLGDLRDLGFSGWRYDEVRGFAGSFVGQYNVASTPYISVGEFWDANRQNVVDWIDSTRGKSMAFDFPIRTLLKAAIGGRQFWQLKTVDGKPTGAIGWWPAMSVTFLDDHDTDKDHPQPDEFGNGDQVLQGYAYLLTHPGIPCVFWPHFFDYGSDIRQKIQSLMAVRKSRGITRTSVVNIVAADAGKYAAIVDGKVAVKLGPAPWDPGPGWNVAVDGNDFAVWT